MCEEAATLLSENNEDQTNDTVQINCSINNDTLKSDSNVKTDSSINSGTCNNAFTNKVLCDSSASGSSTKKAENGALPHEEKADVKLKESAGSQIGEFILYSIQSIDIL